MNIANNVSNIITASNSSDAKDDPLASLDKDILAYSTIIDRFGLDSEQEWCFYSNILTKYAGLYRKDGFKVSSLFLLVKEAEELRIQRKGDATPYQKDELGTI